MKGGRQIFTTAVLLSLAVHVLVAGNAPGWWSAPAREVPFPIEAHLTLPSASTQSEAPASVAPPRPIRPGPDHTASSPAADLPLPQSETRPQPEPAPVMPAPEPGPAPTPEPARQTAPPPGVAESPAPPSAPQAEIRPQRELRPLPERLVLVYNVRAGEGGFNLGQATYTWQIRGERYHLSSVAQATGMASLFMSGRIEQNSEGRIGPSGLMPEQFSMARDLKRQDTARFDWPEKRLILPKSEELLRDNTQDLLSFPFHLAMTMTEGEAGWILPVTNGRKLKGYRFTVLGREPVEVGRDRLEAVHAQGTRAFEGSLDVWLAPGRHWLPIRIRTEDQKGKVIELNLARLET